MRIAYLLPDYGIPVAGGKGASVHVQELIRALSGLGHEVHLFFTRRGDGVIDLPARLHEVLDEPEAQPSFARPTTLERSADSARMAKEARLIALAQSLGDRVIQQHDRRPFDVIYERYSLWSNAGVRVARCLGLPSVIEVNSPLRLEAERYRRLASHEAADRIEAEVFTGAKVLLPVSDEMADYVIAKGAKRDAVFVQPNGVNLGTFHPEVPPAEISEFDGKTVIGFAGGLKPWHGVHDLLEAFRRLHEQRPDTRLLIVGDGPLRDWIEGYLKGARLDDKALITGWVAHEELPGLIARMDVAVAPYPALEDFYFSPLKLFEYLAAGKAIVASSIGQIPKVVTDGYNGLLIEPGAVDGLAATLQRVVDDHDLRRALSHEARRSALPFDWRNIAARVTGFAEHIQSAHHNDSVREAHL